MFAKFALILAVTAGEILCGYLYGHFCPVR